MARTLPRFDRGSGHLRLFHILEILSSQYEIVYFTDKYYCSTAFNDEVYDAAMSSLGIRTFRGNCSLKRIMKNDFRVVLFEFYDTAIKHLQGIKQHLPEARTVIDTVDVHFAREMLMAKVHQDEKLYEMASETRKKELNIYKQADFIWAVTDEDRDVLLTEDHRLNIDIIPNIHKFKVVNRENIENNSLLFIGNFTHQPNEDAVVYFCEDVLPLIQKEIPRLVFYIVGNAPTAIVKALANETVRVVGWVPDTTPWLSRCHVSVVPLRYGGGMKGKVGEAMSSGIPVVTTPVGVQGMDVVNGKEILVSNSNEEFAYNVVELLRDEVLHKHISANAMTHMKNRYDFNVVSQAVLNSIEKVCRYRLSQ
jgi:O-antigen biosynthesis protein